MAAIDPGAGHQARQLKRRALLGAALAAPALGARAATGSYRIEVPEPSGVTDAPLPLWLHRPAGWRPGGRILVVMHGLRRDADAYRDAWAPLAEAQELLLVVPEFSATKFPGGAWYNLGGAGDGQPREAWSFFALDRAIASLRAELSSPGGGFALYGHSAGAQFVHRYLLMTGAPQVQRLVIANAGSYTLPVFDRPYPEGLEGTAATPEGLRLAFARPVTVALGERDIDPHHPALPQQPWAMAQGPYRLARGLNFLEVARRTALEMGAPFAWQVRMVPGVGHSNSSMAEALAPLLGAG
ncbi:hypothetical protein C8P66_11929 [Humitalea rosea]|uniref:Alpha/beta hydrolase family protein n=1 Tax=Humitalea rosea TaxID=990373 RepID=A0A2W7IRR7_9PROT|nr:alpha/beta hydrolase [Humitalea rosea]PZW42137.1 hypothetical protein C8P66_11929 [Humitalea rosea]